MNPVHTRLCAFLLMGATLTVANACTSPTSPWESMMDNLTGRYVGSFQVFVDDTVRVASFGCWNGGCGGWGYHRLLGLNCPLTTDLASQGERGFTGSFVIDPTAHGLDAGGSCPFDALLPPSITAGRTGVMRRDRSGSGPRPTSRECRAGMSSS